MFLNNLQKEEGAERTTCKLESNRKYQTSPRDTRSLVAVSMYFARVSASKVENCGIGKKNVLFFHSLFFKAFLGRYCQNVCGASLQYSSWRQLRRRRQKRRQRRQDLTLPPSPLIRRHQQRRQHCHRHRPGRPNQSRLAPPNQKGDLTEEACLTGRQSFSAWLLSLQSIN